MIKTIDNVPIFFFLPRIILGAKCQLFWLFEVQSVIIWKFKYNKSSFTIPQECQSNLPYILYHMITLSQFSIQIFNY